MFKQIIDFFENFSIRRLVILATLLIVLMIAYPVIDVNFLYFNRIENRINVLQKLQSLNMDYIASEEVLSKEYKDILAKISGQNNKLFLDNGNIFSSATNTETKVYKFLSGSIWCLIILIFSPFIFKEFKKTLQGILVILFLTFIIGGIGLLIPTFNLILINYIGYPLLQLVLIIGFAYKSSIQKSNEKLTSHNIK